jgi:hypothetical protein
MVEKWVTLVSSQSYGQILFILTAGFIVVGAVVGLVFWATRKQAQVK